MQIRVLVGIFTLFTCALLYFLIKNYIWARSVYSLPSVSPYILVQPEALATAPQTSQWLDRLSGQDKREFIYPTTELQVKLLFADSVSVASKEIFRVSVGVINEYQFFCINQVFMANNIEYSYYKIGDNIWLVVATENESYLRSVLEQLRHYEINYNLSKT